MGFYSIALDGPAGAGKSTIAKAVAKELGFLYIDTGAMYRAMALHLIENKIHGEDEASISKACDGVSIKLAYQNREQQVMLNGINVTALIRSPEVSTMTSACSVNRVLREKMVLLQQNMAKEANVVMDGRDIGTKVLPDADLKIYMTAAVDIRAKRRYLELEKQGVSCSLEEIRKEIIERDYRDSHREHSPLMQAGDAVLLDTSELGISGVVDRIIFLFKQKQKSCTVS